MAEIRPGVRHPSLGPSLGMACKTANCVLLCAGSQAATGTGSGEPRWHTVVSAKGAKAAGQIEAAVHWEEMPVAVIDPAADLAEEVSRSDTNY